MKFDGKFEFRWITPGKIVRTFERAEIGGKLVRDSIGRQIAAVKMAIPSLVDEVDKRHPSSVYHDICCGIRARIRQLTQ